MREIILSSGDVVLVSDEDYDFLSQFNWNLNGSGYAYKWNSGTSTNMAHAILERMGVVIPPEMEADHKDRNKLNYQRENLRVVTPSQNCHNRGPNANNTSGVKGVSFNRKEQRWRADIWIRGTHIWLGSFDKFEDAVAARLAAERRFLKQ